MEIMSISQQKPRILVVDDNKEIRQLLKEILITAGFSQVHLSRSGRSALRTFRRYKDIRVILLDLISPDYDGIDLLKRFKKRRPHVQVIILTGHGSARNAVKAMKLGATDFITTPCLGSDIIQAINNCLEKLETDEFLAQLSGKIFLSYAREDLKKVEFLYNNLRQAGFTPWMDTQDILPGEIWEESINNAIRDSEFFIACISRSSLTKRGMFQKELKLGLDIWNQMLDKDIYLLPVRLEPCDVHESLCKFQWVNLYEDDGWQRLIGGLRKGLILRKTC